MLSYAHWQSESDGLEIGYLGQVRIMVRIPNQEPRIQLMQTHLMFTFFPGQFFRGVEDKQMYSVPH